MLTRADIVDASLSIVERDGADALSLRRLGRELGVDATAVYRHFADKDDLLRAVGDRLHEAVLVDLPKRGTPRTIVREVCLRLRAAHLRRPDLAAFVRMGPPLHDHEFALTEVLLTNLRKLGCSPREAAMGYHALIELTVASAAIDAPMAAKTKRERDAAYRQWRRTYAQLDHAKYPTSVAHASALYETDADDRFAYALDRLLDGVLLQTKQTTQSVTRRGD